MRRRCFDLGNSGQMNVPIVVDQVLYVSDCRLPLQHKRGDRPRQAGPTAGIMLRVSFAFGIRKGNAE